MRSHSQRLIAGATVVILIALLARAGQLSPPAGAVSPTMKTLDEISSQISSLQVATGGAPIKRVVRGVIDFPAGQQEASQTFAPSIDPAKSVVALSNFCFLDVPVSSAGWAARSNTMLTGLTATQITVRVDASIALNAAKVNYQIVEYN